MDAIAVAPARRDTKPPRLLYWQTGGDFEGVRIGKQGSQAGRNTDCTVVDLGAERLLLRAARVFHVHGPVYTSAGGRKRRAANGTCERLTRTVQTQAQVLCCTTTTLGAGTGL